MRNITIGPWWGEAARWWRGRTGREQALLGILVALASIVLLMMGIIRPLDAARTRSIAEIRTADALVARLRSAGPALAPNGPPAAAVVRAATAAGVTVQRIEPEGQRLEIMLTDASFESAMRFVATLEASSRLRLVEARVGVGVVPGTVTAQLVVGE